MCLSWGSSGFHFFYINGQDISFLRFITFLMGLSANFIKFSGIITLLSATLLCSSIRQICNQTRVDCNVCYIFLNMSFWWSMFFLFRVQDHCTASMCSPLVYHTALNVQERSSWKVGFLLHILLCDVLPWSLKVWSLLF